MVYLRKVCVDNECYYYLFHVQKVKNSYRKYKRFIGTAKPYGKRLEHLSSTFMDDIKAGTAVEAGASDVNVVEELQHVQLKNGYITTRDLVRLSKEEDIPIVDLIGIASFYSQFTFKKPGKHTIRVCNGTACHVKNSGSLNKEVTSYLGLRPGEVTEDGFIGFESVNCIGACARAPAIMVDDTVYGNMTSKKLKRIVQSLYSSSDAPSKNKIVGVKQDN